MWCCSQVSAARSVSFLPKILTWERSEKLAQVYCGCRHGIIYSIHWVFTQALIYQQRNEYRYPVCLQIYTHTCALLQPKRMWLCSPLFVSPRSWQMHLWSKSWWIFSLNSKSKPHFPSPSMLWEPFMSAMPPASPSNHSLTKQQWKKTSFWILILGAWCACVMNGSNTD